jgi:hypothetical protein
MKRDQLMNFNLRAKDMVSLSNIYYSFVFLTPKDGQLQNATASWQSHGKNKKIASYSACTPTRRFHVSFASNDFD